MGGQDVSRATGVSLAHGLAVTAFAASLLFLGHDEFWFLAGAFSGFLVIAPIVATGLYALSRALERQEAVGLRVLTQTWLHWGSRRVDDPASYWCLVRFGGLLALAGTGWVLTSAAYITLFSPAPIATPKDFFTVIVLAKSGWVFEGWLLLGGMLAAPMFASSVVAMPLLLDKHVSPLDAVLTSWRVVQTNPISMAIWALVICALTGLGFAIGMVGLIVILPLLGHASWHAYRDLVDASALPDRLTPRHGGA